MDTLNTPDKDAATLTMLSKEVARILNVTKVEVDTGLGELGIDSLNVVELTLLCEQVYRNPVNPEALAIDQYTTLRELDRQMIAAALPSA